MNHSRRRATKPLLALALAGTSFALAAPALATTDTTPPSVAVSSPANNRYVTTSAFTVKGTASDNVRVKSVAVRLDGGTTYPATGTTSWSRAYSGVGQGRHTLTVTATDTSGNHRALTTVFYYSPSGQVMPTGNLPGWNLVMSDDFAAPAATGSFPGTAYGAKWSVYNEGWSDTSKNGTYSPNEVISVHGGLLDYHLYTDTSVSPPVHRVAAAQPNKGAGQLYGRYVVRFRADSMAGYKNAWLLWPKSENWNEGEIDFPEGDLNSTIGAYSHCVGAPQQNCSAYETSATYGPWHTAAIEWLPGSVKFILDGKVIGTTTSATPSTAMRWVLQTETALSGVPANSVQGHVYVDWVALYAKA